MANILLSKNLHWDTVENFEGQFRLKKAKENEAFGLFAGRDFKAGETLTLFSAKDIVSTPTYLTVQLDDDRHFNLEPGFLQYMNHSCDPAVFLDTDQLRLVALRDIMEDDELNFFYPSTEWDMSRPFICNCGAEGCQHYIAGAHSFRPEVIGRYRLTGYIQRKIREASGTL